MIAKSTNQDQNGQFREAYSESFQTFNPTGITCSELMIEILEQDVKYIQS